MEPETKEPDAKEIKTVCLADLPMEERKKLCHPSQLDADGNYRLPKLLKTAREAGHESVMEHYEAIQRRKKDDDSKAEQALSKASDDLKKQVAQLNQSVMDTIATIKTQQEKNDERFDKLLNLILSKK